MNIDLARRIYERANDYLRTLTEKESRVVLLEAWRDFESQHGTQESFEKVIDKMPRRVKKRQKIVSETGVEEGWEEIFDYIFPEDEMARPNLKLLAAAKNWKKKREDVGSSNSGSKSPLLAPPDAEEDNAVQISADKETTAEAIIENE